MVGRIVNKDRITKKGDVLIDNIKIGNILIRNNKLHINIKSIFDLTSIDLIKIIKMMETYEENERINKR